ncbi:sodium Bile acid symporter family protein [Bordetella bronchiseptica MBORD707]|nr:sodium Bile acid symporter family protein [Bordetella bronchiseptica MBORD707]
MEGIMQRLQASLERRQVGIYFAAMALGAVLAWHRPGLQVGEATLNLMLAGMLFATFMQVPLAGWRATLPGMRFLGVLLSVNFVLVPALVWGLAALLPADPMIRLAVLLVLLAPCIDYVVTFAQLGRADARALLAATPVLLCGQMLLLPLYLNAMLGSDAAALIRPGPFVQAFVWLIALPLAAAAGVQWAAARSAAWRGAAGVVGLLPVPATALVLATIVAAVAPRMALAGEAVSRVVPVYLLFAVIAPAAGWLAARRARLAAPQARAVAFSAGTRNSLVVLPLALAVPGGVPLLPALIVAQTLVELCAELLYVRVLGRAGKDRAGGG